MIEMLFLFVLTLPLFFIMIITPFITRKTESFGVSIPEDFYESEQLKELRRGYVTQMIVSSVLTSILFFGISIPFSEEARPIVFTVIILLYLLVSFFIYLPFHRKMKVIKANASWTEEKVSRTVIDTKFRSERLAYSNLWFLIGFIIILATFVITFVNYDQMPSQIPMNYSFTGEVTTWATKSYKTVLMLPLMQLFLLGLFIFINVIIRKAKQQISAENPESSRKHNIIFRRRWSGFLIVSGIATVLLLAIIQASFVFDLGATVIMIATIIFTLGILIGAILLSLSTGQGGSRLATDSRTDQMTIDRDEDEHWKLGVFYYNKNDPSIFLEKRFGVGWTNNWAHPLSWVLIIGLIFITVGLPLLLM